MITDNMTTGTRAEILTIGDEILYGHINDTNSQWMSRELDNIGVKVVQKTTVGDVRDDILSAFSVAESRADIVLITGGLGPTSDDLTKPLLAEYFGCDIVLHEEALQEVTEFFKSRGRELTPLNRKQAELPECSEKITNRLGTAPGMWLERNGKVFVSMPGVPYEMKAMMAETIIAKLRLRFKTPVIFHKIIKTVGIGESWLADKIKDWEEALPGHIRLAYLPSMGQVKLRLTATGSGADALRHDVEQQIDALRTYAGKYIYGFDNDELQHAIGRLLRERGLTVALAESCTGGYIAHLITSVAGSSDYFRGGIVPYHNDLKVKLLDVKQETLESYGAVSEPAVVEMSNNVRKRFNADLGIATSGVAGPSGGSPEKPVGTVWIAYADEKQTVTKKLQLSKDREINIKRTAVAVLDLIRVTLPEPVEIRH